MLQQSPTSPSPSASTPRASPNAAAPARASSVSSHASSAPGRATDFEDGGRFELDEEEAYESRPHGYGDGYGYGRRPHANEYKTLQPTSAATATFLDTPDANSKALNPEPSDAASTGMKVLEALKRLGTDANHAYGKDEFIGRAKIDGGSNVHTLTEVHQAAVTVLRSSLVTVETGSQTLFEAAPAAPYPPPPPPAAQPPATLIELPLRAR